MNRRAFTLVELLIVIAILALLTGILLPALWQSKELARELTCKANVAGLLRAVHTYATITGGALAAGPEDTHPWFGVPQSHLASNQVWSGQAAAPTALGLLLECGQLPPRMLFCPADDTADPQEELQKIFSRGDEDAYSSYLYRQLDAQAGPRPHRRLEDLGDNPAGGAVEALMVDMNSLMQIPGVPGRTNHQGRRAIVGVADGRAEAVDNHGQSFTLRPQDVMRITGRLDEIFVAADAADF